MPWLYERVFIFICHIIISMKSDKDYADTHGKPTFLLLFTGWLSLSFLSFFAWNILTAKFLLNCPCMTQQSGLLRLLQWNIPFVIVKSVPKLRFCGKKWCLDPWSPKKGYGFCMRNRFCDRIRQKNDTASKPCFLISQEIRCFCFSLLSARYRYSLFQPHFFQFMLPDSQANPYSTAWMLFGLHVKWYWLRWMNVHFNYLSRHF